LKSSKKVISNRGRPKKQRVVKHIPQIRQFSPRGKPGRPEQVELMIDEYEAIRLTDFEGLNQGGAAQSMSISQQTFSRILAKARKKLADALVNGKTFKLSETGAHIPGSARNAFINALKAPEEAPRLKDKPQTRHDHRQMIFWG